ncbi:hypothetical protein COV24_01970 [candidate division WWE3 bacterium CG10_big_fil_rev_8_21_14_0_10_32_10]|uniref:Glycosyltransferase RgtA/B/C/D-like domain-containing protein n=1 Tax=candidate division WWE3 bacterium CG10_big_fil_rev_8_21_14_0_10_32_10 TaxID=1975090 RepID=A0A2H0RAL6_UNCKA|nr:MAG: hypothetical protein COV24_01970 [candidate division WWE3 bacterium CG10_big_fil_rev_8_21_14_0_10_32_10]
MKFLKKHFKKYKFLYGIFILFLIPRVVGLGYDMWNIDAGRWDFRSFEFVKNLFQGDFAGTYQKYHPGVTVMWLSGFSKEFFYWIFKIKTGYSPSIAAGAVYPEWFYVNSFVAKLPLVLVISFAFAYSILLLKKMKIDTVYLIFFSFLLSVSPFFLGVTRFYHLSGLEAAFSFLFIVSLIYYYYTKRSIRFLFISSLSLALGMLTKSSVGIFIPISFLIILLFEGYLLGKGKENNKIDFVIKPFITNSLKTILLLSLSSLTMFIILWPAMWVAPFKTIHDMFDKGVLETGFGGGMGDSLSGIKFLYYYEMFFIRSTGLEFVFFLLSILFLFKSKNKKIKYLLISSLIIIFYYNLIMIIPSKLKDRYLVPIMPYFLLLSSYSMYYIYNLFSKKYAKAFLFIIFSYFALTLYSYYPSFSAYHTDLFGGYTGFAKINMIKNRGEFYLAPMQYLNKLDKSEAYNKNVIVPASERDRSTKGYLGTVYTSAGLIPRGTPDYFLVEYNHLERLTPNCFFIKGFGPRVFFEFDFLKLYKCKK